VLRESMAGDEAALAGRLQAQAARLRLLRSDADAVTAALRAVELEGAAAASAREGSLDLAALQVRPCLTRRARAWKGRERRDGATPRAPPRRPAC
jgi:hypothetical protein